MTSIKNALSSAATDLITDTGKLYYRFNLTGAEHIDASLEAGYSFGSLLKITGGIYYDTESGNLTWGISAGGEL
jgi:hypothetical protein